MAAECLMSREGLKDGLEEAWQSSVTHGGVGGGVGRGSPGVLSDWVWVCGAFDWSLL